MSAAGTARLDVLDALVAEFGTDPDMMSAIGSYMLGALVEQVTDEAWQSSIAVARSCMAEMAKARVVQYAKLVEGTS